MALCLGKSEDHHRDFIPSLTNDVCSNGGLHDCCGVYPVSFCEKKSVKKMEKKKNVQEEERDVLIIKKKAWWHIRRARDKVEVHAVRKYKRERQRLESEHVTKVHSFFCVTYACCFSGWESPHVGIYSVTKREMVGVCHHTYREYLHSVWSLHRQRHRKPLVSYSDWLEYISISLLLLLFIITRNYNQSQVSFTLNSVDLVDLSMLNQKKKTIQSHTERM